MAVAAVLKMAKIAIGLPPLRIDRSLRNLVRWCKIGLLTATVVKKFEFHKSKTAAILKTVKSPYFCKRLTDFDEIWQIDAHWPLQRIGRKNFEFLKIQDGGCRNLENHKNRNISTTV